jgi:hypothetical protein
MVTSVKRPMASATVNAVKIGIGTALPSSTTNGYARPAASPLAIRQRSVA